MAKFLGVYISVPFCKAKCTFCNFASGVFGQARMDAYVERVCLEIRGVRARAERLRAELPAVVDTVYLGGGTPSLLSAEQMRQLFATLRDQFEVAADAEVTLECAPGQLGEATLDEMLRLGLSRVSFGVQSFVDREASGLGRLHDRAICLAEIARMRTAGIAEVSVDLIAGLPGQTAATWRESVEVLIETGVPHASIYMLEVDEESRLGREVLRADDGELRYGAGSVPDEDQTAEWYAAGCEWLEAAGLAQYEISNFARPGFRSRHNVKYWTRAPYVGFGLDAHSMLRTATGAVRLANGAHLEAYLEPAEYGRPFGLGRAAPPAVNFVGTEQAFEEALFLGLRMNEGVHTERLLREFGPRLVQDALAAFREMEEAGVVERAGGWLRLTGRGRMVSNEVFERLLVAQA